MGQPSIEPPYLSKNKHEEVGFKCETSSRVDGNPECKSYTWEKLDKDDITFPKTVQASNTLTFRMEEKYEGKYRCTCENKFGQSIF